MTREARHIRFFVLVWLTVQLALPAIGLWAMHVTDDSKRFSWHMYSRTPVVHE